MSAATTRAYVSHSGDGWFHADLACRRLTRLADEGVGWCQGGEAHHSRLQACPACAVHLQQRLDDELGVLPSGIKRSRALPHMRPLLASDLPDGDSDDEPPTPYGAPADLDDVRFSNKSRAGWGTASFGQDPDEFLGSATDDDNDWRGGSRFLD